MFRDGPLEQILKETPSDCVKDMLPKYIHDFIQLTQASIQITKHYKVSIIILVYLCTLIVLYVCMYYIYQGSIYWWGGGLPPPPPPPPKTSDSYSTTPTTVVCRTVVMSVV